MSTHNICFRGEIRKILCGYPLLSVAMVCVCGEGGGGRRSGQGMGGGRESFCKKKKKNIPEPSFA